MDPNGQMMCLIKRVVKDIDTLFERIKDKVAILMKPKDQFYGIREFTVQDRFDFILTFAQIKE
jgi:uncharacterized glyoxalase superfamily protein PhnB